MHVYVLRSKIIIFINVINQISRSQHHKSKVVNKNVVVLLNGVHGKFLSPLVPLVPWDMWKAYIGVKFPMHP